MTQILTVSPALDLLDRGEGVADLQAALTAVTDTNLQFLNDGNMCLAIDNQNAGARQVTLRGKPDPFGRTNDVVISVPAGQMGFYPFISQAMFGPGGTVSVDLDAIDDTSVGLIRLTKRT